MTYRKKLARAMSRTVAVGSFFTYDQILLHLQQFTEEELRKKVTRAETEISAQFPGMRFIDDDTAH